MLVEASPLAIVDLSTELSTLAVGLPSRVVARVNESCLRVSIFAGEGSWHVHPASDELFLVLDGELTFDFREGRSVTVGRHQMVTVPAGTVHRPRASLASTILCFKHTNAENQLADASVSG